MLDDLYRESIDEKKPDAARVMDTEKLDEDIFRVRGLNTLTLAEHLILKTEELVN